MNFVLRNYKINVKLREMFVFIMASSYLRIGRKEEEKWRGGGGEEKWKQKQSHAGWNPFFLIKTIVERLWESSMGSRKREKTRERDKKI